MGIHTMMLGNQSSSQITAGTVIVEDISVGSSSVSVTFSPVGTYFTSIKGSNTVLGNWVTPPSMASGWEIRATLTGGTEDSPGVLNTWQPINTNRSWEVSRSAVGSSDSVLTFDFRRVGSTDPEVSIEGNFLSVEVLDTF
jgi:hypothetical protein